MTRTIQKRLATAQDIAHGVGKVNQQRGQQMFELDKVDIPLGLATEAEVTAIDPLVYPRIRVGSKEYQAQGSEYQATHDIKPLIYVVDVVVTEANPYVYYNQIIFKRIDNLPATLTGAAADDGLDPIDGTNWEIYLAANSDSTFEAELAAIGSQKLISGLTADIVAKLLLPATELPLEYFGAIGDGTLHPLSERYATLLEAQAVYPFATTLTQSIDWAAAQAAALSDIPIRLLALKNYWITDEIDYQGKPLRIRGGGSVSYTPNLNYQPRFTFDNPNNLVALFKNYDNEGTVATGFAVTSTATFAQNGTTRKITINRIQYAFSTNTSDGQKFFDYNTLVIRGFRSGIKFNGDIYNWGNISNIKYSFCRFGFEYKVNGVTSNHMNSFRNVHFCNVEAGILGCGYDDDTGVFDLDQSSNVKRLYLDNCVFEFNKHSIAVGGGFAGDAVVITNNCYVEQVADAWLLLQDTDWLDIGPVELQSVGAASITYSSRGADDRYNKSEITVGMLNNKVAVLDQIRTINPKFHDVVPELWKGGSIGNPTVSGTLVSSPAVDLGIAIANGANISIPLGSTTVLNTVQIKAQVAQSGETTRSFGCLVNAIASGGFSVFGECHRSLSVGALTFAVSGSNLVVTNASGYPVKLSYKNEVLRS